MQSTVVFGWGRPPLGISRDIRQTLQTRRIARASPTRHRGLLMCPGRPPEPPRPASDVFDKVEGWVRSTVIFLPGPPYQNQTVMQRSTIITAVIKAGTTCTITCVWWEPDSNLAKSIVIRPTARRVPGGFIVCIQTSEINSWRRSSFVSPPRGNRRNFALFLRSTQLVLTN